MISFLLNDKVIEITQQQADLTLLNYLRENQNLCGTKEGCASGDCGACTVVIADVDIDGKELKYTTINSCVSFLSAVNGKQLITVEHLAEPSNLHPVQQAMVDKHGSQCGFCTPGFIMSMFALYHDTIEINRHTVELALSGNLCRCTGYKPIIDAALSSCNSIADDKFSKKQATTIQQLQAIREKVQTNGIPGLYMPRNRDELASLIETFPQARLVAGSTDLALEVTQMNKVLPELISLSRVDGLNTIKDSAEGLSIGAALPFSKVEALLFENFPELKELVWRFASKPIRNQATVGGNVANASPIGDFPPVLLALNAKVCLDDGENRRIIPADHFFTEYRQTAMHQHEWIESIYLPKPSTNTTLRAYKVSKRFEDDISAVCAVFSIAIDNGNIVDLSTGFGGVAATPVSVPLLSEKLMGRSWSDRQTMLLGCDILQSAFEPIDDVRASAEYRNQIAANLFQRFWLETSQHIVVQTRVADYA
jgi:xanthine dehydrogenase small subunit